MTADAQTRAVQQAVDFEQLQIPGLVGRAAGAEHDPRGAGHEDAVDDGRHLPLLRAGHEALRAVPRRPASTPPRWPSDPEAGRVGVTGAVAARVEAESEIDKALPYVEIGTVLIVALVLGDRAALAARADPDVVRRRHRLRAGDTGGAGGRRPDRRARCRASCGRCVLVLLLAIVTDYCVFFLTEMRRRLTAGEEPREAAYCTGVRIVPIVVTAGLIVAAGTGTLLLGSLGFFRALGPGMAVTAIVGTLVSLTLVPALLAISGRLVFRGAVRRARPRARAPAPDPDDGRRSRRGARPDALPRRAPLDGGRRRAALHRRPRRAGLPGPRRAARLHAGRGPAGRTLPRATAADDAAAGFAPGIIAPTEVLSRRRAAARAHGRSSRSCRR